MTVKIRHSHDLGPLATFKPNRDLPRHRWFYYKEGYARDLVFMILDHFGNPQNVFDPFCGSGTTLLACKERGIASGGIDTSPLSVFVSRVKTADYDIATLKEYDKDIMSKKPTQVDIPDFNDNLIKRAFLPKVLDEIFFYKEQIDSIQDETVRNFFIFALMSAGMKSSFAFKDGAVVKIEKRPLPPLKQSFKRQVFKMLKDIESSNLPDVSCKSNVGDARMMDQVDAQSIITSPPYLNKIEYTNIYRIELELFLETQSQPQLRSYIGTKSNGTESFEDLPEKSRPYFIDMKRVIEGCSKMLSTGSKMAMVVGNACFAEQGLVINSDEILAKTSEDYGFKVNEIVCLAERWCTKRRTQKVDKVRESIIFFEKN